MMVRNVFFSTGVIVAAIVLVSEPSFAAGKKTTPQPDTGLVAVERVLRSEVVGQVDRREQLAGTLREQPDSSTARWQAGFVRDGKAWRSFEESAAVPDAAVGAEYISHRREAPATFAGRFELANWCKKQSLADQERAHLWAALELAPTADQPAILMRLGFLPVGNQWLTRAELSQWRERNQRALASVKHWGPRLEKLVRQLEGSQSQRDVARAGLLKLTDPEIVPAIEYVMCGNKAAVQPAIDTLSQLPGHEATLALVKQAVFSDWPEIRRHAAEALQKRPLEDFVPSIIAMLASTISTASSNPGIAYLSNGEKGSFGSGVFVLLHSYLIARETNDQFQVGVLHTTDYRISEFLQGRIVSFYHEGIGPTGIGGRSLRYALLRRELDLSRDHAESRNQLDKLIDDMNERTDDLNRRIIDVLAIVSGQEAVPDLKRWWDWWNHFTDTQSASEKPVVISVSEDYIGDPTTRFRRISCFAAGTPVWTDHGPSPIESVRVGDRVLAKDVETGELAYKPVLKTTVRPPKELTTLRLDAETIVCTGGHRFWNSGSGWIKARDIAPQTTLHTVTGNVPVWTSKKGETAETYNLVVADFHTYFVGKTGVLCQDLLLPPPTNNIVPGLSRANAVAQVKK